jgi:hypothetical protein
MKLKERSPPANNSPKHGTQIVHMCQNISLVKQLPNLPFINSFKLTTKPFRFNKVSPVFLHHWVQEIKVVSRQNYKCSGMPDFYLLSRLIQLLVSQSSESVVEVVYVERRAQVDAFVDILVATFIIIFRS